MAPLSTFIRTRMSRVLARSFAVGSILGCLLLSSVVNAFAQATPSEEYQLKAVFLFRFVQFVDWPPEVLPDETTAFVIGILGDDPFGAYLEDIVRGEKVMNRPLEVQRYRRPEDIKTCHVLFISRSTDDRSEDIVAQLKGRSILTVGETDGFARSGGVIRFATDTGKVRLKVNVEAAKAANLTISSKLLRSVEIVTPGKG